MNLPIRHEILRFVIAGAINTIVTYAIYLALLSMLGYVVAYSIAYVIGIALAYVLNTWFVFRVPQNIRGMLLFPLVYVVQYLVGIITLQVAVREFDVPQKFALLVSIAVSIPVTYLLSRFVLKPSMTNQHHDRLE
jgi:putative flippase GtrA